VINRPGEYDGFSANYSGAGFSDMKFKFHGMTPENFEHWVQTTKAASRKLDRADYLQLEQPSAKEPVRYYGTVDPSLYHAIVNRCIEPGQTCMDKMMAADGGHQMTNMTKHND
jgi:cytochrome o ubiquinol oxidase subunit 2